MSADRSGPRSSKNASSVLVSRPALPQTHLLPVVVGDQGQVVVVLLPRHLVHPDVHQPVEAVGVQAVGHHPLTDPPDGVPVDPQEPGDRGLVGLGGQERGHVLEVTREPGPRPGERHRLHQHPVRRALQAPQQAPHDHYVLPEVQVPPPRRHRPGVVPGPGDVAAPRLGAGQLPGPQPDIDHQLLPMPGHGGHPDPWQVQQVPS
jgi:hypothetical protein